MIAFASSMTGLVATWITYSSALGATAETVTIRGESFNVWPRENLVQRGFDIPDVPRERNAAWVYIEAINRYAELPPELNEVFDYAASKCWPEDNAKLTEYLSADANREAIALVDRASRMEKHVMPSFGDPKASVIAVLLPNLSHYRFLAKLVVADGHRLEARGQFDEALERYLSILRMGEHLADGVILIESLVGQAVWTLANQAITNLALHHDHTSAFLSRLSARLEERALHVPTIERGLEGESAIGPGVVDEICASPFRPTYVIPAFAGGGSPANVGASVVAAQQRDGWARLEMRVGQLLYPDRTVKKHMKTYFDAARRRARAGSREPDARAFNEDRYVNEAIPKWDVFSRTLLPALGRAQDHSERTRANAALTRAAVMLRRYALAHEGRPPVKLSDAVDEKPELYLDPFSGEPLIFRPTTDGWLLYSIGPNQKDDGGQPGDRRETLDIVVEFPPPPFEPFTPAVSRGGR